MSKRYPDKVVIGLTGNIATGKSIVRRMVEHLGAFGIDADGLSHRAMSPGAPAYEPVTETFGKWVVNADGSINRARLGRIVFNDPEALATLETLVHPVVRQAVDVLIRRSKQQVVVVEAIKLLEGPLAQDCDAVWVVDAPPALRLQRLMQDRGMSEQEARTRIAAQGSQAEKLAKATTVIDNGGGFDATYEQVQKQYEALLQKLGASQTVAPPAPVAPTPPPPPTALSVRRAGPRDLEAVADFINKIKGTNLTRTDVMMRFGQQAYILAFMGQDIVGLAGLQVENLIARVSEFILSERAPIERTVPDMITALEDSITALQGEIALVYVPNTMSNDVRREFMRAGYEPRKIADLAIPDWREAAEEAAVPNATLFARKMRADRILKPL